MDARRRSARRWVALAVMLLLLALFAYVGNMQGWMSNAVSVPLALLGMVSFAAATLRATFVQRSLHR